jgi:predicted Zn-dependent protease
MSEHRRKPTSLEQLPSRYPAMSGKPWQVAGGGRGPSGFFFVLLALLVASAGVLLWRATSGPSEALANGAVKARPAAPREPAQHRRERVETHEAVRHVLDSARAYMRAEDFGKAEAVLAAGVKQFPEDQEVRLAYAETLVRLDRTEQAYTQYKSALLIGPRDPQVDFVAGTLASRLGRIEDAADHYNFAQTADPSRPEYPLYLAQMQLRLGDANAASANLLRVIRLDPSNATAYGTLSEILLQQNNVEMSLQQVAHARRLEPQRSAWKIIEARGLKRKGDVRGAMLVLGTLPKEDLHHKPVMRLTAECYGLLGRPGDAARLYADAAQRYAGDAQIAFETAAWFERAGQLDRALEFARAAERWGHEGAPEMVRRLSGR